MDATYAPVPDADLFLRIAALPSVTTSTVDFADTMTGGQKYGGTVYVDGSVPLVRVLDQVNAILWQGRPRVELTVEVVKGTPTAGTAIATQSDLGLRPGDGNWRAAFEARYGAQPGTGSPPATSP